MGNDDTLWLGRPLPGFSTPASYHRTVRVYSDIGLCLLIPTSECGIRPLQTGVAETAWESAVQSLCLSAPFYCFPPKLPAQATSGSQQTYSVSGSVVNSATGEGVPRAMVRTNGSVQRNMFSDSDGHFQFDRLPPGQITVTAQKPGFFSDQDVNGPPSNWISIGSNSSGIPPSNWCRKRNLREGDRLGWATD